MKKIFTLMSWGITLFCLVLAFVLMLGGQKNEVYMLLLLICVFLPPLHRILAKAGTSIPWFVRLLLLMLFFMMPETRDPSTLKYGEVPPSFQQDEEEYAEQWRKLVWKELARTWKATDPELAKQSLLKKYRMSEEELDDIRYEAYAKKWPTARPTPAPKPPQEIITGIIRAVGRPQGKIFVELTTLSKTKIGARISYTTVENPVPAWTLAYMMMSLRDLVKALTQHRHLQSVRHYEIDLWLPLKDEKGKSEEQAVISLNLEQQVVENLDWDFVDYRRFYQLMQQQGNLWVHPQLLQRRIQ